MGWRRVPKRVYESLRAEEACEMLRFLAPHWRPLFAAALYTAMRKGELLGLRKSDVDFVDRTITVRLMVSPAFTG